ncbi:MAG: PepSY domain-containing protein [Deltaproteobacteria bacterium]|nr:PepSY domain-containing protein [Deltaproteobacteria bacterium]
MTLPARAAFRRLHRWTGIALLVYFALMAVSGVLLNHPSWIAGLDLPRRWVPGPYELRDWNRNALRGAVPGPDGEQYLFGEAGVWRWRPGSGAPAALRAGFEPSLYYRDTRALLRLESPSPALVAGTRRGLYRLPLDGSDRWQRVPLGAADDSGEVVDLLRVGRDVVVLTRDRVYRSTGSGPLDFRDVTPARADAAGLRVPLFRLVFHAHSGATWGLPGRLAVDALGLTLLFLAITGAWFWWRKRRRTLASGRGGRLARAGLSWHLRLGLYLSVPLLFVTLTGILQRPPFLLAVAFASYPRELHPGPADPNPWHDALRKAVHDPGRGVVLVATSDGFYEGPEDLASPLEPVSGGPPLSVMGATVLRRRGAGEYWVGSMSGLYLWDRGKGHVLDAFTGRPPLPSAGGPVGEQRVVGSVVLPGGDLLAADYDAGLLDLRGGPAGERIPMPEELSRSGRISLWHVLFELHNGRLFGFLLGWWAWLVVPLGGLALAAEVVSGVWLRAPSLLRRKERCRGSEPL